MRKSFMTLGFVALLALAGCSNSSNQNEKEYKGFSLTPTSASAPASQGDQYEKTPVSASTPSFTIAWSPYTSWSALVSAEAFGYLDNRQGYQGEFERRNNVDIVFRRMDYLQSFGVYGAGTVDGLLITNTDAFAVADSRKKSSGDATVALFPTSYSDGADKILVEDEIKTWADLSGVPVKGAEFSVTQYLFWRGCQVNGVEATYGSAYTFENLDPVPGSVQFAGGQNPSFRAFGAWSPETFTVLNLRNGDEDKSNDVIDLFNSSKLDKYEITDMLVMGQKALDHEGGPGAVKALGAAMQAMTDRTNNPGQQAQTYKAISPNFNDLDNGAIGRCTQLTRMLGPQDAVMVFDSAQFKGNMPKVQQFSLVHKLVATVDDVPMAWGTKTDHPAALLRFDTSYVK
ncbi:hypothetical protein HYV70_01125 [Candidatus Uhrbacteria bacterium]|nr:hypothetical protein [Candidatus Uhrbacteria bacterium]